VKAVSDAWWNRLQAMGAGCWVWCYGLSVQKVLGDGTKLHMIRTRLLALTYYPHGYCEIGFGFPYYMPSMLSLAYIVCFAPPEALRLWLCVLSFDGFKSMLDVDSTSWIFVRSKVTDKSGSAVSKYGPSLIQAFFKFADFS
jgi:hypothetical protein